MSTQFQQDRQTSNLTDRGSSSAVPLQIRLDRESWTDLCVERFAIMTESGDIADPLAKEMAYQDTTSRFGRGPAAERKAS